MNFQEIWDVFFDNSSADEGDEDDYFPPDRQRHVKVQNYFEHIVLTYSLTGKASKKEKSNFYNIIFILIWHS